MQRNNIPEITDLLQYWPMLEIFDRESIRGRSTQQLKWNKLSLPIIIWEFCTSKNVRYITKYNTYNITDLASLYLTAHDAYTFSGISLTAKHRVLKPYWEH